jgi:uncharacterized protein (UPF0147 family)
MVNPAERVSDVRPYIERALKDEAVRKNVKHAFDAVKEIYDELTGEGAVGAAAKAAMDEEIHENLRTAAEELRLAARRLQGKEDHGGRNTMLLLTGIALGVLFNPFTGHQTREWLKQRVFGSEQTFDFETHSGDGSA